MSDAVPRRQNRDRRQERRQENQEQADAVDTEVIIDRRLVDPLRKFFQVISGRANRHPGKHQQREKEFRNRNDHGDQTNVLVVVTAKHYQRERTHSGEKNKHGKQMSAGQHQRTISMTGFPVVGQKKITAITTSAPTTTHTASLRVFPDCARRTVSPMAGAPSAIAFTVPSSPATST